VDLSYLDDGLHLTGAGHEEFGDRVAAALSTARRAGR
jgi:lysophospholipase L1-like esterase